MKSTSKSFRLSALALALLAAGPVAAFAGGASGSLRVLTPTEPAAASDGVPYYPHAAYTLYRADGSVAAFVRNHSSAFDEAAETVSLPEGVYQVRVEGERAARTVVVRSGRLAVVDLDKAAPVAMAQANILTGELVR